MVRDTPGHKQTDGSDDVLPNQITVVGRGTPLNFEFTVTGQIEMIPEPRLSRTMLLKELSRLAYNSSDSLVT